MHLEGWFELLTCLDAADVRALDDVAAELVHFEEHVHVDGEADNVGDP